MRTKEFHRFIPDEFRRDKNISDAIELANSERFGS
jgi:hypothetical protein